MIVVFYSCYPFAADGEPGETWTVDSKDWSPAEFDAMLSAPMQGPSDCILIAPAGDATGGGA